MKRCKKPSDVVAHFKRRCIERIGFVLDQNVLKNLLSIGKIPLLRKQSLTKTLFVLKKEDYIDKGILKFDVVLVYDKLRHAFVTTYEYNSNSWR